MNEKISATSISFTDVLWGMLTHWKLIIICAVIGFAVANMYVSKSYDAKEQEYTPLKQEYDRIMGAYEADCEFVRQYNALPEAEQAAAAKTQADIWRSELTSEQLSVVDNAVEIKKLINQVKGYLDTSILMNLDPYNVSTLYMIYEVASETVSVPDMLQRYTNYILGQDAVAAMAEKAGLPAQADSSLYSELITAANISGNQFAITVQMGDSTQIAEVDKAIQQLINKYKSELNTKVGEHSLTLVQSTISVKANNAIVNTKNGLQNQITNYNNQLNSLKNTFANNPKQLRLYNYESLVADGESGYCAIEAGKEPDIKDPGTLKSRNTYKVVGLAAGVVVGALIVYIYMLFATRLQKSEELYKIYGMPVLGRFFGSRFIFIDKIIAKIHHRTDGPTADTECVNHIAERIISRLRTEEKTSVAFIYTSLGKKDIETLKQVEQQLTNAKIKVVGMGDIRTSADVVKAVDSAEAIVVAERVGKAAYRSVESEVVALKGANTLVLGAIAVE